MRTHYRNGVEIGLKHSGCDGCCPSMINGILCHEHCCGFAHNDDDEPDDDCGFEPYYDEPDSCYDEQDEDERNVDGHAVLAMHDETEPSLPVELPEFTRAQAIENALQVIVSDRWLRNFLDKYDPNALEQAETALGMEKG